MRKVAGLYNVEKLLMCEVQLCVRIIPQILMRTTQVALRSKGTISRLIFVV